MGFFGKAGAWLKEVFGTPSETVAAPERRSSRPPAPVTNASNPSSAREASAREASLGSTPPSALGYAGAIDPIRASWDRLKSFVARCDSEDLDLAGLRIEDPIGFWSRHARIESAKLRGVSPEDAARAEGLKCLDHWLVIERYFQARYSELVRLPGGKVTIRFVDAFQRASEQAERAVAGERERLEAEARELEPIGGVSLERFAEIAAALAHLAGAEATRARTTEVLGTFGIGAATFGSVRRGWEARMASDKTRRLRRAYRAAWTHATEMFGSGEWELPTCPADADAKAGSKVSTRYTWVESVEARPEYRSSLMTG
jgi:hypothetical protein